MPAPTVLTDSNSVEYNANNPLPVTGAAVLPSNAVTLFNGTVNLTNASGAATLTPAAGKTAYLTGFEVNGAGSTAGVAVGVTVAGIIGGTRTYAYTFEIGPLVGNKPLQVEFLPAIPATGPDVAIVVTCPASGAGGTANTVNAHGFYR
jgi:hypothetical protein